MKISALILGILSLFTFSSCKCDFDEDEAENKYDKEKRVNNDQYTSTIAQNDTLRVK